MYLRDQLFSRPKSARLAADSDVQSDVHITLTRLPRGVCAGAPEPVSRRRQSARQPRELGLLLRDAQHARDARRLRQEVYRAGLVGRGARATRWPQRVCHAAARRARAMAAHMSNTMTITMT